MYGSSIESDSSHISKHQNQLLMDKPILTHKEKAHRQLLQDGGGFLVRVDLLATSVSYNQDGLVRQL